jgi:hypothetical protein
LGWRRGLWTIKLLRQVNAVRQIEIAELMVGASNYTHGYVEALILGTPKDQLIKPVAAKKCKVFHRRTSPAWSRKWRC